MRVHLFVLLRLLEVVGAAVGCINALELKIATSLTRILAVTLDLPPLAFVASDRDVTISLRSRLRSITTTFAFIVCYLIIS